MQMCIDHKPSSIPFPHIVSSEPLLHDIQFTANCPLVWFSKLAKLRRLNWLFGSGYFMGEI